MSDKKRHGEKGGAHQPTAPLRLERNRSPRNSIYAFKIFAFLAASIPLCVVLYNELPVWSALLSIAYLILVLMSVHVARHWERAVVLRLGRFNRVEGPGLFFTIPFFESAAMRVDQRIVVTSFSAEEALTADLVPTNVDAVLFWMVVNPQKAWCEVDDYPAAVSWSAQTALRDAIGRINLAEISTRRTQLDRELKEILNEKTSDWGISVISVEIRNILIPEDLQEAMSREAQAQQESNARLILAEIEQQIAELYVDSAMTYRKDELAFQIRMASMVNESVKEGNNNLIVVPSTFGDGFNTSRIKGIEDLFGR